MIETAAIVWACAATGLGILAAVGWGITANRADDLKAELDQIKLTRHHAAKAGHAAQLAQRAAKIAETTARLKAEVGR
jgi:hypothetical protein